MGKKKKPEKADERNDEAKAKTDEAKAKGDKRKDKNDKAKAKGDKRKKKSDKAKAKGDKAKGDKAKGDKAKAKSEKAKAKGDKAKAKSEKAKARSEKAKARNDKAEDDKRKKKSDKTKGDKAEAKGDKARRDERSSEGGRRIPLTLLEEVSLGLRSASAVAPIGGGRSLVVDDDEGLYLVEADGRAEHLAGRAHAEALGDLESLCTSDDGKTAYAVAEESGEVLALAVKKRGRAVSLSSPRTLGTLARPGDTENKGWEGACFLAKTSTRGPCLVVAHEREPMALAVYALPALTLLASIPIDETPLGALIDDVADVAVYPSTDHLFLLSDESHRIVETRLDVERASLEVLATFDLSLRKKDKPEGLAFESPDRLVVVTDDPSRLLRFALG